MKQHTLQLASAPYSAIVAGIKTIESRLFDDKRQLIQLGDTIEFINRESTESVLVRVVGLLRYETFHSLFSHNNPSKFGGESVEWLEDQINEFYSVEQQKQDGVIGIEFVLL